MERVEILQHKLNSAQEVHDHVAEPGWINPRAPRATKLRLDGDALEMSRNYLGLNEIGEKVGIGVKGIEQNLEVVIQGYKAELNQINARVAIAPKAPRELALARENTLANFTKYYGLKVRSI